MKLGILASKWAKERSNIFNSSRVIFENLIFNIHNLFLIPLLKLKRPEKLLEFSKLKLGILASKWAKERSNIFNSSRVIFENLIFKIHNLFLIPLLKLKLPEKLLDFSKLKLGILASKWAKERSNIFNSSRVIFENLIFKIPYLFLTPLL